MVEAVRRSGISCRPLPFVRPVFSGKRNAKGFVAGVCLLQTLETGAAKKSKRDDRDIDSAGTRESRKAGFGLEAATNRSDTQGKARCYGSGTTAENRQELGVSSQPLCASAVDKALRPDGHGVSAAHVRLNQSIDHECRADMDSILPCVPAMQFDRLVQIRNVECSGEFDAAVALDPRDNVVWSGCAVGTGAMLVEFEFFAMRGHGVHDAPRGFPAIVQRRR